MVQNLYDLDNYKLLRERLGKLPFTIEEDLLSENANKDSGKEEIERMRLLKCLWNFNYTNEEVFKESNNNTPLYLLRCNLRPENSNRNNLMAMAHQAREGVNGGDDGAPWQREVACEEQERVGLSSAKSCMLTILLFSQLERDIGLGKQGEGQARNREQARRKNKIRTISPMLMPDSMIDERTWDSALHLYQSVFDTIPGIQGIGEAFSFIINDQFYKPAYGHFSGKLVELDHLASLKVEDALEFTNQDLVLRECDMPKRGLVINPVAVAKIGRNHLYKISPFMSSYYLLGIITNFIHYIKAGHLPQADSNKLGQLVREIF